MKKLMFLPLVAFLAFGCDSKSAKAPQEQVVKTQEVASTIVGTPATSGTDVVIKEAEEFLEKGDFGQAISVLQKGIKQNPSEPKPYFLLGQISMHAGDAKDALEAFKRFTQLQPDNGEGYLLLGGSYDMLGEKDNAIANVQKSVEIFQKQRDSENFVKAASILRAMVQAKEGTPDMPSTERAKTIK